LDIFHSIIFTMDFRDNLSHGNPRVSGGGQVDRDRTGKMSRKISGKWASAGTRLKKLRRTGELGESCRPMRRRGMNQETGTLNAFKGIKLKLSRKNWTNSYKN